MIAKGCPKCDQQVPVACKACPCGHSFFSARRAAVQKNSSPDVDLRRRTQRVRREKPNYYDSLEYDKQVRKTKTRHSESANDEGGKKDGSGKPKRKKSKKEDDEDDEIIQHLSSAKQYQCSVILDELNRKLEMVTWKPT